MIIWIKSFFFFFRPFRLKLLKSYLMKYWPYDPRIPRTFWMAVSGGDDAALFSNVCQALVLLLSTGKIYIQKSFIVSVNYFCICLSFTSMVNYNLRFSIL